MKLVTNTQLPEAVPVRFPAGLIGFESVQEYSLREIPGHPHFCQLQAVDDSLSLLLVNPFAAFPLYEVDLDSDDLQEIGLVSAQDALILTTVTINDADDITTNLAAPLVINTKNRLGCQVVQKNITYSVRQALIAAEKKACCG